MASGHWEQRSRVVLNENTGARSTQYYWVWVAATTSQASGGAAARAAERAAAQRRAKAIARKAAKANARKAAAARASAAAVAYAKQQAANRAAAYKTLQQRQSDLIRRARLLGEDPRSLQAPKPGPTVQQTAANDAAERRWKVQHQAQANAARAFAFQRQQRAHAAAVAKKQAYEDEKIRLLGTGFKPAGPSVGFMVPAGPGGVANNRDASSAERLLREAARKGGNSLTPEEIRKLQGFYEQYGSGVYSAQKSVTARLNALLSKANNRKLPNVAREAAWKSAKALYYGEYAKNQKEFSRLFGDGRKQGSYVDFYKSADRIAQNQREWWKAQMKASLNAKAQQLQDQVRHEHGVAGSPSESTVNELKIVKEQQGILSGDAHYLGKTIDHYELKIINGDKKSVAVYRPKTIEEALQDQQARLMMEQEKVRAQYQQQTQSDLLRSRGLMRSEGLVRTPDGRMVDARQQRFTEGLLADAKSLYGVDAAGKLNMPTMKRAEDVQHVADDLLKVWVKKHPAPEFKATGNFLGGNANAEAFTSWQAQRDAYQAEIYKFFGSSVPGSLERVMALPGVSHLLSALQTGTSSIGAGVRVTLKATTGSSQIGKSLYWEDLPKATQEMLLARMKQRHPGWAGSGPNIPRWLQDVTQEWADGEGAAYASKYVTEKNAARQRQDEDFASAFYGQGSLADKVDALNAYGSVPTTQDATNLAFQLLVDPTNAIPLKFTTYLARGKYAAQLAGGASKANPLTWAKGAKNFLSVDEGVLKLEKQLSKFEKELRASGLSPEAAADDLRHKLAGLTDPTDAQQAFHDWAKALGLDPKKINEGQIFNLSEFSATKTAAERGNLFTQQKALADQIAKHEQELKTAAKNRLRAQRKATADLREARDAEYEASSAARERLAIQRESEEAAAVAAKAVSTPHVAAVAGQQATVAAREAVGTPPARPPRPAPVHRAPTSQPGPLTEALRGVHARVETKVKKLKTYKQYESWEEYYKDDGFGHLIPKDRSILSTFVNTPEYKRLLSSAREPGLDGDLARAQLAHQAGIMRNAYRTFAEDATHVRMSKFTPSHFDVYERAGILTDEAAQKMLDQNRATIRHLRRVSAAGNADPYVRGFRQQSGKAIARGEENIENIDEVAASGDAIDTGFDIQVARDESFRGLREIYEPFSEDSLRHYRGAKGDTGGLMKNIRTGGWVEKLPTSGFMKLIDGLTDGLLGDGVTGWRDGGLAMFSIFHQLRLSGNLEKLHEFSNAVDVMLSSDGVKSLADLNVADEATMFAWEWKLMEYRAGLPWAKSESEVMAGFKSSAEAWGLDPDLAAASIPNGYRAQRPPIRFGLSPNLHSLAESDRFSPAPAGFSLKKANDMVTDIFTRQVGEPTQVVHFVAQQYGDFVKGTPVRNRVVGELTHAVTKELGLDEMARRLAEHMTPGSDLHHMVTSRLEALRQRYDLPEGSDISSLAARRGEKLTDAESIIKAELSRPQRRIGNSRSFLRPDYPAVREEVLRAYWAGDLPLANARAHELMYLVHMQNAGTRDLAMAPTRIFLKYMRDLGFEKRGQEFVQSVRKIEFDNLAARYAAEMKHGPASKDALTGEASHLRESSEWQMWGEAGFAQDAHLRARLLARDEGMTALRREADEIAEADAKREGWLADERNKPSDAYTGVASTDQMEDILQKLHDVDSAGDAWKPAVALINRIAHTGGMLMDSGDEKLVTDIIDRLRELPGGNTLLRNIQESIGNGLLAERLATSGERLAYQEATLRVRLRVMEYPSGKVKPQFTDAHTTLQKELESVLGLQTGKTIEVTNPTGPGKITVPVGKSRRINFDEMRKEYEASAESAPLPKDPDEVKIAPAPVNHAVQAPVDGTAALLARLSGMTEREWMDVARQQARKKVFNRKTPAAQKEAARRRLRDLDIAEYSMEVDRRRGTYVDWKMRAAHRDRVLSAHAKDAEDYIAPKNIAPYARDAYGSVVEEVRTWVGQLRRVGEDVPGVRRLGTKFDEDYFPVQLFDEVEQEVAAAIRKARGWEADNLTRLRGSREELQHIAGSDPEMRASRLSDKDAVVLKAKQDVLRKRGISIAAYDEARKVLWRGYVQRRTNQWLIARSDKVVEAAKTLGVKNPSWDKAYQGIRARLAREEARRQLGGLAYGEMFGREPQAVFDEFVSRYSSDGNLHFDAPRYSAFQRKTLEQAVQARSGVADLDSPEMAHYLQSANRPPFEKGRTAVRDWLVQHGAWSPRKAEEFTLGKRSWNIEEEAKYWRDNFGYTPDWTNPDLLRGSYNAIFHNDELYYQQMRAWGTLDRSMDLKLRLDGTDAKQIERARVHGDPQLGIPARRELEAQRRFAVERYGDLVGERVGDGTRLTAMPWLMYPDEISTYLAKRGSEGLPEGLIQNADELAEVTRIIEEEMSPLMEKMLAEKAGAPITYEDIYSVASEVQARLLADPKWKLRMRDRVVGSTLDKWTGFNRWLVFSNPSFLVMNVVDAPIKMSWYRMTRRGLFNPGLHGVSEAIAKKASELTPVHLGLDAETTIYRLRQRKAVDYARTYKKGMAGVLDRAQAPFRAIPEVAGMVELGQKMNLARGMYPQVYSRALARLGDADLADVWAKNFIKQEVNRMWPTAGDGPAERLFNRVVPFASYMVRNKILFLSEALANPRILNELDYIGRYIEAQNLANWEADPATHGTDMPSNLRRRLELPWAPGYYLDLGQFSDATRGLKPLYNMGQNTTVLDFAAQWVRVINPSAQAGIYAITNALGITQRTQYIPILDERGYPTGRYEKVTTGWTEPWSDQQPDIGSVFWFVEGAQSAAKYWSDGFTEGELSQLFGQVFLFNAVSTYDRGTAYFTLWKAMDAKDPEAAEAWLQNTPQGSYLRQWMVERASKPRDVMDSFHDMERAARLNKYKDWFALSQADRTAITQGHAEIKAIREAFGERLLLLQPGTAEYRDVKAQMYWQINNVYLNNPAMLKDEVLGLSASEWSNRVSDWQTDKLMDDYMALVNQRPKRAESETSAEFNKKTAEWNHAKNLFLQTYPQVQQRLGTGILALDSVKDQMNKDWTDILNRVSQRNDQIDAAKAILAEVSRSTAKGAAAQDRLDILYLQNDLDYNLLNKDYAASYFSKEDFDKLPFGHQGPQGLKPGISLPRMTVLDDFATVRYNKAVREGTLDDFIAKEQYGRDMKAAILYAKNDDPFGEFSGARFYQYLHDHPKVSDRYFGVNPEKKATFTAGTAYFSGIKSAVAYAKQGGSFDPARFVAYLKSHPKLQAAYFKRHAGKQQQWAHTDEYIRRISVWGKLMGAHRWDAAQDAWDALPMWVRERYLGANPDASIDLSGDFKGHGHAIQYQGKWFRNTDSRDRYIAGKAYFDAISPWGKAAASGDWDRADALWAKMPKWVKDRYYAKHPGRRERAAQTASYLGYMKRWIKYFDAGDKAGAKRYFNSLPNWAKERYYAKHPDKRVEFSTSNKMWQKLSNYFASDPSGQANYLAENPDLQRWLAKNAGSSEAKRIAIMNAYKAIPKDEAWLRRVFREKYPDVFSAEALGERKLKRVYDTLVQHPEISDEFDKWVKAIWDTYAEMLKHANRPLNSYITTDRKTPARDFNKSLSAAQASR